MATYKTPGVYVEEIPKLPPSVAQVSTAVPAFIGCTEKHPTLAGKSGDSPVIRKIDTLLDYETLFGGPKRNLEVTVNYKAGQVDTISLNSESSDFTLYYSLSLYFKNGGGSCYVVSIGDYNKKPELKQFEDGVDALKKEDEPTLILLTDAVGLDASAYCKLAQKALAQCGELKDRFVILDVLDQKEDSPVDFFRQSIGTQNLMFGAAYYPSLLTGLACVYDEVNVKIVITGKDSDSTKKNERTLDSLKSTDTALYNQIKTVLADRRLVMYPSAAVAGVYASVDRDRGVWKAPANVGLASVIGPVTKITNTEQDNLNIDPTSGKSINAIRAFTGKGTLVWGARTLAGNDNEWRYVPVRRLFNMIEESIQKATAFAVFEPNDAGTWLKVKAMIESYLYGLWQQGALAGPSPDDAYYVHVGLGKTMTSQDVLEGRMIVEIGVAAVRPAEFIVLRFMHKLQQA